MTDLRKVACGLAAASIGLAGCGGSAIRKESPTVTLAPARVAVAPARATEHGGRRPRHRPVRHGHLGSRLKPSPAAVNIERAARIPTSRRLPPTAVDLANPTAMACLRSGGFLNPHRAGPKRYVGTDQPTGDPLFMIGAFRTPQQAAVAARSFGGSGYALSAGVFVVESPVQTQRMKAVADLMSRCLALSGSQGGSTF